MREGKGDSPLAVLGLKRHDFLLLSRETLPSFFTFFFREFSLGRLRSPLLKSIASFRGEFSPSSFARTFLLSPGTLRGLSPERGKNGL